MVGISFAPSTSFHKCRSTDFTPVFRCVVTLHHFLFVEDFAPWFNKGTATKRVLLRRLWPFMITQMFMVSRSQFDSWSGIFLVSFLSHFLLNSRSSLFCDILDNANPPRRDGFGSYHKTLFIPKLQSQFAEFLQYCYLIRLSILYQFTCVGFNTVNTKSSSFF